MKRFTFILLLTFTQIIRSVAANQASITIDDREKYQHISGFGGFGPSPSWDDIVSVRYYNLNGTEIEMPQNGLYIVKTTYSNGKTQVRKEIK